MEARGSHSVTECELRNQMLRFYSQTITQWNEISFPDLRCVPVIYVKKWEKDLKPHISRPNVRNRKGHPPPPA